MIGFLSGILKWHQESQIIIDVNGVGYQVEVVDAFHLPEPGKKMELFIYTYVREDTLTLFGFNEPAERELFITLLGVSGIGPRAALNILSTLPYEQFVNAIMTENIPVLKQVSGIGVKTAQRLILELQGKLEGLMVGDFDNNVTVRQDNEIYEALQTLGYSTAEIDNVIKKVDLAEKGSLEDKIKALLSFLGKGGN